MELGVGGLEGFGGRSLLGAEGHESARHGGDGTGEGGGGRNPRESSPLSASIRLL